MKVFNYIIVMLFSVTAFSQIVSPNGNNLFYYNGLADVTFRFSERGSGGRAFVHAPGNVFAINYEEDFNGGTRIGRDVYFKDGGNSFISSGNFGIGTSIPNSRLDLGSGYGINGAKFLIYNDDSTSELSGTKCGFYMDNFTSNNLNLVFPEASSYPGLFTISGKNTFGVVLKPYFSIAGLTGNVGIGTINPTNKLDVNGTIHSKEVKVDMEGWSDFVFKKEYNLPTLEEVEKHIAEKGHLENIPSEEEVLKNGISLGEMNAKLLQKIEEMTLYMIEMKKEIELLKNNKN
ncbi:hypothetical protein [Flavobacterium sp. C3NV]|uniref:hypothetical protein n=1 Tax=Flavobacterium sp. C3NV TaxID=3393358 RepID=UPI0039902864